MHLNALAQGKWHCPVHYCDEPSCGKKSKIMCESCPNSFCCKEHVIAGPRNERLAADEEVPTPYVARSLSFSLSFPILLPVAFC